MLNGRIRIYKHSINRLFTIAIVAIFATLLTFFEEDKEPIHNITAYKYNIRILDGDTFSTIVNNGNRTKIRLYGVDCPEKDQPSGQDATKMSTKFLAEKIKLKVKYTDKYGRIIAIVTQNNGVSLQESLLLAGLAWVDERFCKKANCNDWRNMQTIAKTAKRGLWNESNPVPPWNWRKGNR